MRVVLAPDSFKECLSAAKVAAAMEWGVREVAPEADCTLVPMADGGEGTASAVVAALGGYWQELQVHGPMGTSVGARFGKVGQAGVFEVASAVGLGLVAPARRDIWSASSRGAGQTLRAMASMGIHRALIGLGGSATNDGGIGLLAGLGAQFFDQNGHAVEPLVKNIPQITQLALEPALQTVAAMELTVASDVTNPLCGREGASAIFGPQKGATQSDIEDLDRTLAYWGRLLEQVTGKELIDLPGAGAAGGMGVALLALGAQLRPGVQAVGEAVGLPEKIRGADLVFTGEGKIDGQTRYGKTPYGVAQMAAEQHVPTIAVAGTVGPDAAELVPHPFAAVVPTLFAPMSLEEAKKSAAKNIASTVANCLRLKLL